MAAGKHRYCKRHSSYFCPCVRPEMYRAGDKRADPALWDKAVEDRRAKADAKREEARLEYVERTGDELERVVRPGTEGRATESGELGLLALGLADPHQLDGEESSGPDGVQGGA